MISSPAVVLPVKGILESRSNYSSERLTGVPSSMGKAEKYNQNIMLKVSSEVGRMKSVSKVNSNVFI